MDNVNVLMRVVIEFRRCMLSSTDVNIAMLINVNVLMRVKIRVLNIFLKK